MLRGSPPRVVKDRPIQAPILSRIIQTPASIPNVLDTLAEVLIINKDLRIKQNYPILNKSNPAHRVGRVRDRAGSR